MLNQYKRNWPSDGRELWEWTLGNLINSFDKVVKILSILLQKKQTDNKQLLLGFCNKTGQDN